MRVCGMCGSEHELFDTIDYDYDLYDMELRVKEVWGCPKCDESYVMIHHFALVDEGLTKE